MASGEGVSVGVAAEHGYCPKVFSLVTCRLIVGVFELGTTTASLLPSRCSRARVKIGSRMPGVRGVREVEGSCMAQKVSRVLTGRTGLRHGVDAEPSEVIWQHSVSVM